MPRPSVCRSIYVGSSSPPPIGRLHLRHCLCHRRLRLARRWPGQLIALEPPSRDVSSIARCFAQQEGCRCIASSGSSVTACRRPRRCIYMLSTLLVRVSCAWSSPAVRVLCQHQAPPSRYSGVVEDLPPTCAVFFSSATSTASSTPATPRTALRQRLPALVPGYLDISAQRAIICTISILFG